MTASQLDNALQSAIAQGGSEPDIIRNYVNTVSKIQPSAPHITIKTGFIHQRPYAFFVQPTSICNKTKCELGDILYVFKKLDASGNLIQAKASFVQVKKGINSWHIEPHQLEFLSNIKTIHFRFGNSVYKQGGISPIIYNGLRYCGNLSQYLLIGGNTSFCYPTKRIRACQPFSQRGFSINVNNPTICPIKIPFCPQYDSHLKFLNKFFIGKSGANVLNELQQIIELIYKKIGWIFDPPEEFADNFIEDERGFAIIEITSSTAKFNDEETHRN
jgi:hypothetical protein